MDMKQAMYERHMVRKYLDKPIPQECREKIEQHTKMLNDEYGVDISLVLDNTEAFNAAIKLILCLLYTSALQSEPDKVEDYEVTELTSSAKE